MFTLKSFGITTFDSLRELLERLLPFFFACPSRLASWFFSFAFSCWRTAFVSSSFFCPSRIESILLLILSIRTSCLSWTGSFAAIILSRKNPNTCPQRNETRPSEWTTVKDQISRDYSFGHLIGVHTVFVMRIRISASLWGRDIPRPRYKRALFNVQLEMSGDVCSSELFTSCSETPVSLFSKTNAWEVLIPFVCGTQITLNLEHQATFCLFIGYTVFLLELI